MNSKEYKSTAKTIRCGNCGNKTLMRIISEGCFEEITYINSDYDERAWINYDIFTLLCPHCKEINLIKISEEWDTNSERASLTLSEEEEKAGITIDIPRKIEHLYPPLPQFANTSEKAKDIRDTYKEALTCFQAELYTSSVAMCRKTIELLCLYFEIEETYNLSSKLAKMREIKIIDNKLYEWVNQLKKFGNDALHTTSKFSKEDAQDILDFTYVIVEYCIDFDYKFDRLLKRRGGDKTSSEAQTENLTEETIDSLVKALDDSKASIRYCAAITLAQNKVYIDKVIPVLLALTERTKFSSNATSYLKNIGLEAVTELIKALESDSSHNIRAAAATILGDIKANNPDIVAALVNALKNENEDVQYKAATALEKIGSTAIDTFIDNLDS